VNELVDETLLMELYGPPFAAAVKGVNEQAAGVMWCVASAAAHPPHPAAFPCSLLPPPPPPAHCHSCSAYNRVNGVYACENPLTLKTMLKGRYNFSGFVVCA
jgi:beta-glucosidase-like glycosyl hydrolase